LRKDIPFPHLRNYLARGQPPPYQPGNAAWARTTPLGKEFYAMFLLSRSFRLGTQSFRVAKTASVVSELIGVHKAYFSTSILSFCSGEFRESDMSFRDRRR